MLFRSSRLLEHDRLWEATEVVAPSGVPGRSRRATLDDLDLVTAWCLDFMPAADRQAGRQPQPVHLKCACSGMSPVPHSGYSGKVP